MLWIKTFIGVLFQALLLATLVYLPAWTLYWTDALIWAVTYYSIVSVGCIYLLLTKPASIEARLNLPSENQPQEDKFATTLMFMALGIGLISCPLDVFHLQLTPIFTGVLKISGLLILIIGLFFIIASMDANEFAETTVNIQEERGQRVIDSGVYSLVRHPMYTGFLLFLVGTNLWLGTYLSLILSILSIAIALKFRITIEEKTLINELEGYKEYSERVKTRIIPFIL